MQKAETGTDLVQKLSAPGGQWKSRVYTEVCDESTSRFHVQRCSVLLHPQKAEVPTSVHFGAN